MGRASHHHTSGRSWQAPKPLFEGGSVEVPTGAGSRRAQPRVSCALMCLSNPNPWEPGGPGGQWAARCLPREASLAQRTPVAKRKPRAAPADPMQCQASPWPPGPWSCQALLSRPRCPRHSGSPHESSPQTGVGALGGTDPHRDCDPSVLGPALRVATGHHSRRTTQLSARTAWQGRAVG